MHNFFMEIVETLDEDSLIIIPDYMSSTHLGAGPEHSQGLENGDAVPVFGVTFLYLNEDGNIQRTYVSMVCDHAKKTSWVTIQYLRKIFGLEKYKNLIQEHTKVYVIYRITKFFQFNLLTIFL